MQNNVKGFYHVWAEGNSIIFSVHVYCPKIIFSPFIIQMKYHESTANVFIKHFRIECTNDKTVKIFRATNIIEYKKGTSIK